MTPAVYATAFVAVFVVSVLFTGALLAAWDRFADRVGLGISQIVVPLVLTFGLMWTIVYTLVREVTP